VKPDGSIGWTGIVSKCCENSFRIRHSIWPLVYAREEMRGRVWRFVLVSFVGVGFEVANVRETEDTSESLASRSKPRVVRVARFVIVRGTPGDVVL
jgi:hypothetical protein